MVVMVSQDKSRVEETLQFEAGSLSKGEIDAILETLPVDITFVDREDRVKYFNKAGKRIFVRTKAVLGRKVQLCHPKKSRPADLHQVLRR